MNLTNLKDIYKRIGCKKLYIKKLSPNDNSKNQVYFGGSFEILNILPLSEIHSESAGDWKRERFKADINFSWLDEDGKIYPAPKSQIILYPKYPEVRFSGFLSKCENAPSDLMTSRIPERLFFLGITETGSVVGFVVLPDSEIANEYNSLNKEPEIGIFSTLLIEEQDNKEVLLSEMRRIHKLGWIESKRFDKNRNIIPCNSSNCGGYTLETELGISPNGYSEPDYLGWEIKQFGVSSFSNLKNAVITLMTPEPTNGFYVNEGVEAFVRKYGYDDLVGREDRKNFGGIHKIGEIHERTKLKLELIGFDKSIGKIRNTDGKIVLLDNNNQEAASWSFSSLLLHWTRKHNQACFVPSMNEKTPIQKYRYGDSLILGMGTDFQFFLSQLELGNIFYDPGIKLENISTSPKVKRRSQFRIKSNYLQNLYKVSETINLIT